MTYTGSLCPHTDLAFKTGELHLEAAIREYERAFNVVITPHVDAPGAEVKFGNKYFVHTDNANGQSMLVDLHIIRGAEEICPKQDLNIVLFPDDLVDLGLLVC